MFQSTRNHPQGTNQVSLKLLLFFNYKCKNPKDTNLNNTHSESLKLAVVYLLKKNCVYGLLYPPPEFHNQYVVYSPECDETNKKGT